MYKHILVAVDGSEHAMRATKEAIKLAHYCNETVIDLVYVADSHQTRLDVLHASSLDTVALERRQRIRPYEIALEEAGIQFKSTILKGQPGPTIVTYAHDHEVDLVVIGSRGLNKVQEMVLGSVSHKVMKRVNCPALIVK